MRKTVSCSIQPVINKSTAREFLWRNRVRSHGRNERLEPYVRKPTCTVLRGGGDGNITPLTRPWTKRRRYGTILVDLETHRLLALLADCEVETVAAWFRQHPSVQIVTRDRSLAFADAIRLGAPHALQIADRFHLHMNVMTCLETLLTREQATLRRVVATLRAEHQQAHPAPSPQPLAPERQRNERRARRYARYEQVVQLKAQGWSQRAIAQETGLHPQTVAIYLKAGQFPERAPHPRHSRVIEPYLEYLHQRWEQGEHNGRLLFEEIRARGYQAGLTHDLRNEVVTELTLI